MRWLSQLPSPRSNRLVLIWSLILTVVFELLTCFLRFACRLESTRDTASTVGRLTCGLRVHHSYLGAAAILVACWGWERWPRAAAWLLVVGLGLFFSDLLHHFAVLWYFVGDPQFDLFYPDAASRSGSPAVPHAAMCT